MRKIAIVGGHQASLALGVGLQKHGYDVTLVSRRNWRHVGSAAVTSSQCTLDSALELDRRLGINYWESSCPRVTSVDFAISTGGTGASEWINWNGRLSGYAQSVDQRLKLPHWMREFERLGGRLRVERVGPNVLETYADQNDLVIVGAGRRSVAQVFPSDPARSPWLSPRRTIALAHVRGMRPTSGQHRLVVRVVPGVGEYSATPALTTAGPCDLIMFQAVPGSGMDRWKDVRTADEHVERSRELLRAYLPEEAERCRSIEPTDPNAALVERLAPTVREPIGRLASGRMVLGLGDTVVLTDPLAGLGASSASRAAATYLDAILQRPDGPYDEGWMRETFDGYWRGYARWAAALSKTLLESPQQQRSLDLFTEASRHPVLADTLANGFDDPSALSPWFFHDSEAERVIHDKRVEAARSTVDRRELRRALGQFATGVTIVATRAEDGFPVGLTVNSFTSVSLDPPLVLWCAAKRNPSLPHYLGANRFSINVLASNQSQLSQQFATPLPDKFDGVAWTSSAFGMPFLDGAVAVFACKKVAEYEAGDHLVFIGEIEDLRCDGGVPLIFHSGKYQTATGH